MKKGYLIVNGFLREDKFTSLYASLCQSAERHGIKLELKTNIELMYDIASGSAVSYNEPRGFAIFWDKDVRLARALEKRGMRLFNSSAAIELCDDKALCHIALMDKVPQPKTVLIPLTFPRIGYTDTAFLERIGDYLGYPLVLKQCFGSFGAQVYMANDIEEAEAMLMKLSGEAAIAQQYIQTSFARDVRAYVAGERVAAAMLRYNESGDFRANVARGGSVRPYRLSADEEKLAVTAAKTLGCDFAGVDLLFGKDGMLVCEVNSNAHFGGIKKATGINVANAIMEAVAQALPDNA